jgi:hypothetical protein
VDAVGISCLCDVDNPDVSSGVPGRSPSGTGIAVPGPVFIPVTTGVF